MNAIHVRTHVDPDLVEFIPELGEVVGQDVDMFIVPQASAEDSSMETLETFLGEAAHQGPPDAEEMAALRAMAETNPGIAAALRLGRAGRPGCGDDPGHPQCPVMVLTDTSILIEWAQRPSLAIANVVISGRPAVCGISVAELYEGVRSDIERRDLEAVLRLFGQIPTDDAIWEITGRIAAAMTRRGTRIKFPDAAIAATGLHHSLPLWTRDGHFAGVQAAFPELVLFSASKT